MSDNQATVAPAATALRLYRSTPRYLQAAGLIDNAGEHIAAMQVKRCAVLCSARSQRNEGKRLLASLEQAGIEPVIATFGGECSLQEVEKQTAALREQGQIDALIALGGGKPLDAGKCIAHRLDVPVVIFPTLASNDAPCSAISVLYTPEGVTETFEVFPQNPALVMVDTAIIAEAPARFLVAGMGDAMATWYEARICHRNPNGLSAYGARPTLAGVAISQTCADILYKDALAAIDAVEAKQVTPELENVVEANTLLSGLGFECTGLAAAHGVAQALTVLEHVDKNYLHGEMVAIGILVQLALEADTAELERVARLFAQIGLPITLEQIGMSRDDEKDIAAVAEATLAFPLIGNMIEPLSVESIQQAFLEADSLGRRISEEEGSAAYSKLHG
ncbi:glycerol dehydrogenase [Marinobacterium nitratireducens]|uniref:Glycerol dehydrogenase n=1 Tax=Marinobacterium nitratireducens TaxID=518897 RepID=A0A917ZC37_9GAMM|nr:glycerol dehydrogenase [Marinobacterium nitratireducens]GGO78976.1 glycerol dehydrogenase [Marinobacterium nitratireducens]